MLKNRNSLTESYMNNCYCNTIECTIHCLCSMRL